jgi:hypothetical protein
MIRSLRLCAPAVAATCLAIGCSATPDAEPHASSTAPLDPNQVSTPTSYTVTLSSIQVVRATEPNQANVTCYGPTCVCSPAGGCNNPVPVQSSPPASCEANTNLLWTPDKGYIDWAQLGFKVASTVPGSIPFLDGIPQTTACSFGAAPTGSTLTNCLGGSYLNGVFNANNQLSLNFTVNPGDQVTLALAVDNIEEATVSAVAATPSNLATDLHDIGDGAQLLGAVVGVTAALTGGSALFGAYGGAIGMLGNGSSFLGDFMPVNATNGCSADTLAWAATSCTGGLMGLSPTTTNYSAPSNPCWFNAPNPDALRILDPTTNTPLSAERLQAITANGPVTLEFTPNFDLTTPSSPWGCTVPRGNSKPQLQIGCSSSLKIDVTISRNWTTGLAASAKSADMADLRAPGTIDTFNVQPSAQNLIVHRYGQNSSFTPEFEAPAEPVQQGGVTLSTTAVVVSRTPNNNDAFWVDDHGGLNTVFQQGPYFGWKTKNIVAPGFRVGRFWIPSILPSNAQMSAISRSPTNLDVFAIGSDGNVYTSYWNGGSGVDSQGLPNWAAPFSTTTKACVNTTTSCAGSGQPGGPIASVARWNGSIDVFYIGKDGGVWTTFWDESHDWTTMELYGPSSRIQYGAAPAAGGAGITATARTTNNMDLFFIGTDGGLWTSAWTAGAKWGTWEIMGTRGAGLPGAPVSAVSRQPSALDVIFQGPGNSTLRWAYWSPQRQWSLGTIPTTGGGDLGLSSFPGNVSLVAPTSYSLQAFYLDGIHELNTLTWSDPTQCNDLLPQGCSAGPSNFPWSRAWVLPTAH